MNNRPLSSKTIGELLNSYLVLQACSNRFLVKSSTRIIESFLSSPFKPIAIPVVRRTFFRQFCAGESIEEVEKSLNQLEKLKNYGILDYAAENSSADLTEDYFQKNTFRIKSTIELASRHTGAMAAIKMSSLIPYNILKDASKQLKGLPFGKAWLKQENLIDESRTIGDITNLAKSLQVPLLIDAENIEIQPAIDFLTINLMHQHNSNGNSVVSNTYQMYLTSAFERLQEHLKLSRDIGFAFGLKLVRGAYLRSDKNLSSGKLYGPIFDNVEKTHAQYNQAIEFLMEGNFDNLKKIVVATHNENSVDLALRLMSKNGMVVEKVIFAQLLGMATDISFKVQNASFQNSKYLPFGPIELTIPYLARRAEENAAILRNKSELQAILKELKYRLRL